MNEQSEKPTPANRYMQIPLTKKKIFINNFVGGIAWGLGATVGLSIILAVFGILLHFINVVPVVGNFVAGVIDYIKTQGSQLK